LDFAQFFATKHNLPTVYFAIAFFALRFRERLACDFFCSTASRNIYSIQTKSSVARFEPDFAAFFSRSSQAERSFSFSAKTLLSSRLISLSFLNVNKVCPPKFDAGCVSGERRTPHRNYVEPRRIPLSCTSPCYPLPTLR